MGLGVRSLLAISWVVLLLGCGGSKPELEPLPSQEADWLRASRHFEEGHYIRAIEALTAYVEAHPGSNRLDEVWLMLGLAHRKTGEHLLAVEDFNRLIQDFPQSPHREQAEFRRAESYWDEALSPAKDPESTETALNLLRTYLLRYPEGDHVADARAGVDDCRERLARKAFFNAETYFSLKHDRAAVIYLEKALETKADFSRAGEAIARLARAEERLGETAEARSSWERLIEYATPEKIEEDDDLGRLRLEALERLESLPPPDSGEASP